MSKVATAWPTVRQVIYSLLAALAGGAGLFGLITQDQADQWLTYAASALSGLGLILATVNVQKPAPAPAPALDAPDAVAAITSEVDRVRAQIEAEIGKHVGQQP